MLSLNTTIRCWVISRGCLMSDPHLFEKFLHQITLKLPPLITHQAIRHPMLAQYFLKQVLCGGFGSGIRCGNKVWISGVRIYYCQDPLVSSFRAG